uniref:Putative hemolymph juvenile hormone binding protein n=1 Tax=Lutzomyia longipalpis TaxID=7200 RepID=A0A7G3AJ96_LUTLO
MNVGTKFLFSIFQTIYKKAQKMGNSVYIFSLLFTLSSLTSAQFPPGIEKCHYGDSECIIQTASKIIVNFPRGIKEIGLPSIDPQFHEKIDLKRNLNGALNLQLFLRNVNLYGFSTAKILQMDGFTKEPKKLQVHFKADKLEVTGDYKLRGEFLLFPMTGEGKTNNTMLDFDFYWNGTVKLVEKDNEKYLKLENYKARFTTTRIFFFFDNLFGGDKALAKSANEFFNDNWRIFFDAMKPLLFKLVGQFFGTILNEPFSKIPYNNFFLED